MTLILIFVVLVGAGVSGYWLLNKSGSSPGNVLNTGPQNTLDTYCDGLKNKNAQELYNTLDAAHQKQTSVDEIQQTLDDLTASGGVKSCTYNNVQINGSTATATMTITLGSSGDKPYSAPFKLTKENGDWKLSAATMKG